MTDGRGADGDEASGQLATFEKFRRTILARNTILTGDATQILKALPDASVDCVITSPPYVQTRDYGARGQLGMEPTVHEWVADLRQVFREVARVLVPTGGLWLNLGDSFSRHPKFGAPTKGLLLAPERLLLALAQDGWLVRNKVIWAKTNPLPSSAKDRLTLTYELVYFLVRSPRYFFDLDAIREPHRSKPDARQQARTGRPEWAGPLAATRGGLVTGAKWNPLGKNPGDVWQIATSGFRGAHFATFPPDLVRRPLLVGCPPTVCTVCGKPGRSRAAHVPCSCGAPVRPGLVLDPFFGSGTVGVVARELGRDFLGIELKPEYVRLAEERLGLQSETERRAA